MSAIISTDGVYRYRLERVIGDGPTAAIFGVNPSTADAKIDDQTIRKDMGFARRLGWGRIIKGNKFAFRAKDVKMLKTAADPVGPENDEHLDRIMHDAQVLVVAWGPLNKLPPFLRDRWRSITALADRRGRRLMCWGTAQDGQPRHPLMLAYDTPLIPWIRP